MQDEQSQLVDRDAGVGDAFAVAAEVDDRLAEGGALETTAAREFEGVLGQPDEAHAVVDTTGTEAALRDLESSSGTGDDGVERQPDVGEGHLTVAAGLVEEAHGGEHAFDLDTRGVEGHEDHRMSLVLVGFRNGEAHENEHLAVGSADAGAPPLAA